MNQIEAVAENLTNVATKTATEIAENHHVTLVNSHANATAEMAVAAGATAVEVQATVPAMTAHHLRPPTPVLGQALAQVVNPQSMRRPLA